MIKNLKDIIVIILIAVSLGASFIFFTSHKDALAARIRTEERLFKEKVAKKQTEELLSRTESEKDGLRGRLSVVTEEAKSLESELVKQKSEAESVRQQIAQLDNEALSTEGNIKQCLAGMAELESRIANIVNDSLKLAEEIGLIQKTTEALKARLAQLESENNRSVSSPDKESGLQVASADIPPLQGEVLTVNREFDFIVISLGKNDGIEEGAIFDVVRDNKPLGQVKVETVRDRISAAALVNKESIVQMRPGDRVYSKSSATVSAQS